MGRELVAPGLRPLLRPGFRAEVLPYLGLFKPVRPGCSGGCSFLSEQLRELCLLLCEPCLEPAGLGGQAAVRYLGLGVSQVEAEVSLASLGTRSWRLAPWNGAAASLGFFVYGLSFFFVAVISRLLPSQIQVVEHLRHH